MRQLLLDQRRRVLLAVLVLVSLLTLIPGSPTDPALAVPVTTEEETAAALVEEHERDLILDVIRRHRRGASDSWRQHLASAIHSEARRQAVDPLLVASIVATESSFRSRVVSRAGAVGLMQAVLCGTLLATVALAWRFRVVARSELSRV